MKNSKEKFQDYKEALLKHVEHITDLISETNYKDYLLHDLYHEGANSAESYFKNHILYLDDLSYHCINDLLELNYDNNNT